MRCPPFLVMAAIALPLGALPCAGHAEDDQAEYWAVTGVARNDVLHLRDVPSADSKSLAGIPPNTRGLKNLGCWRNELPLDQWMRMTKVQRQIAAQTRWCRVEYNGKQGWVSARYLRKDEAPAR